MITLLYDKKCPLCDNYCQRLRLLDTVDGQNSELQLIDARQDSQAMQQITDMGWDIDQGMVLNIDDQWYYGADAIHAISLLSSRSGWFNQFNYWVFKSAWRSKMLYPVCRSLRNVLLKLMRVKKINNLQLDDNERF